MQPESHFMEIKSFFSAKYMAYISSEKREI
jgi:hypothetical protein